MLADLKSYYGRVLIALRTIIHSNYAAVDIEVVVKNRGGKVCSDGRQVLR